MGDGMEHRDRKTDPAGGIGGVAAEVMAVLVDRFPVCSASDEFHFFPHAVSDSPDWEQWDDLSDNGIAAFAERVDGWMDRIAACRFATEDEEEIRDAVVLAQVLETLIEQLTLVRSQTTQPTFYLTIIGIGLAEAMEHGDAALAARLAGLPGFLDHACQNLRSVPEAFCAMGLAMLPEQKAWLRSLPVSVTLMGPVRNALAGFEQCLRDMPARIDRRIDPDLYARVADRHMGCGLGLAAIEDMIQKEIAETLAILTRTAEQLAPGRTWQAVIAGTPPPPLPPDGVPGLYRGIIAALAEHCVAHGLLSAEQAAAWPVRIETIPEFMRPVRSNAAYSAVPGHPPGGGTFYLRADDAAPMLPPDYRLLTAHETFPGHHLLDSNRWNHSRMVRRHIEFPIFYEGWASFSEELMFDTGFFHRPMDALLLAKRRFWRAMRGRADLAIHSGATSMAQAASDLAASGMDLDRAKAMIQRYALKPGYQLAYTIGRRRFRQLYDRFRLTGQDAPAFARRVLALGEIPFDALAHALDLGG